MSSAASATDQRAMNTFDGPRSVVRNSGHAQDAYGCNDGFDWSNDSSSSWKLRVSVYASSKLEPSAVELVPLGPGRGRFHVPVVALERPGIHAAEVARVLEDVEELCARSQP